MANRVCGEAEQGAGYVNCDRDVRVSVESPVAVLASLCKALIKAEPSLKFKNEDIINIIVYVANIYAMGR